MIPHTRLALLASCILGLTASPLAAQVSNVSPRAERLELELVRQPNDPAIYIALALEYEARGHADQAEATLRLGLMRVRDTRPVRATLVEILSRLSRWNEALDAAEPLGTDSLGRAAIARLRVNVGLAALRAGRRSEARTQWERALQGDPSLVEAAVNLGAVLLEDGDRDSARAVAARALVFHPDHPRLLILRVAALGGTESLPGAVAALSHLRAQQPRDEPIGLELASLLSATGERARAAALYDTLLKAPGASERAYQAGAQFWLEASQFNTVAALLETSLARFPRSGALYALLGEAEAGRSEWRKAIAAYRRAGALLPRPEDAEVPLFDVLVSSGDTAEAQSLARLWITRPSPQDIMLQSATRLVTLGRVSLADSTYQAMLDRDPMDLDALEGDGLLAERAGDTTRAVTLYQRAASRDSSGPAPSLGLLRLTHPAPDSARVLLRRAVWRGMDALQALELAGASIVSGGVTPRAAARAKPVYDRQRVIRDLLRAALDTVVFHTTWGEHELGELRLAYPQSALLERYVADLTARRGDDRTALASYEMLLRRDPSDVEIHRSRASLLERMGRPRDAIDAYTRAFDLAPEDEATFRSLQRLRQANGTLAALLSQVQRLRIRLPDSRRLGDHEVEVLQRLGRMAEAQATAKSLNQAKP